MASSSKTVVHRLLERAHSPDTANHIFTDKVQFRPQLLRPTSPSPLDAAAATTTAAVTAENLRLTGHDAREARRRHRRHKQEQRRQKHCASKPRLRPKPLSSRQRRALGLYDVPMGTKATATTTTTTTASSSTTEPPTPQAQSYATFLPLHRLWLGYIREVLGPELRSTAWEPGSGAATTATATTPHMAAAIKLTAADFHGAAVQVTRSACVGRVGIRGIVVRDTRFVFQIVTPDNKIKTVPKEGTFFRIVIPVAGDIEEHEGGGEGGSDTDRLPKPQLVVEILGSQFMHRAPDRANRKFKQHFYKEL